MVEQPALHVENLQFLIGAPLEAFLEGFGGPVTEHSMHAGIVYRVFGIKQEALLDLAIRNKPVSGFPV